MLRQPYNCSSTPMHNEIWTPLSQQQALKFCLSYRRINTPVCWDPGFNGTWKHHKEREIKCKENESVIKAGNISRAMVWPFSHHNAPNHSGLYSCALMRCSSSHACHPGVSWMRTEDYWCSPPSCLPHSLLLFQVRRLVKLLLPAHAVLRASLDRARHLLMAVCLCIAEWECHREGEGTVPGARQNQGWSG